MTIESKYGGRNVSKKWFNIIKVEKKKTERIRIIMLLMCIYDKFFRKFNF